MKNPRANGWIVWIPFAALTSAALMAAPSHTAAQQASSDGDSIRYSFRHYEQMSDEAYWDFVFEGFREVVEGHAWGNHLRGFLERNAKLASIEEIEAVSGKSEENAFWVTIHPPSRSGLEFYFRDDLRTVFLPRIPIDQHFAGIIFAHELQHAYDRLMSPDTRELSRVNNTFVEMRAYKLEVDLLDNFTQGAFRQTLREILANKEYDRKDTILYRPDKQGRERLEQLLGPPSLWEFRHRDTIYAIGLSYEASDNAVERSYATTAFKGFQWLEGLPPYMHAGLDFQYEEDTPVHTPIQGHVIRHESQVLLDSDRQGVVIEGGGPDTSWTVRVLGVEPRVPIGEEVGRGQEIGISQAPDRALKDIPPYLHVELYLDGTRTVLDEVDKFVTERWPQIRSTLPTIRARVNLDLRKILKKAFEKERERDYQEAIRYFREALPEPWFEVTNTDILHYLARSLVNAGRFDEAVEVQCEMLRLLELEKAYAEGGLPDPELGTIARHMRLESLDMFITHMKANLEAYKRDQQTVYVY